MANASVNNQIVSYESEPLILVNNHDEGIGYLDKAACHDGNGKLHRAFSIFLFNKDQQILLQQRVANKRLWPMFWSNSCCSHPRQNETIEAAVKRRMHEELGVQPTLQYLYKFQYQAKYQDLGSEHELCYVFIGRLEEEPSINTSEINDWKWVKQNTLTSLLEKNPDDFTPWLKLEWQELKTNFAKELSFLSTP